MNKPIERMPPKKGNWIWQKKWDGVRAYIANYDEGPELYIGDWEIGSNRLDQYPEMREAISQMPEGSVLDGELVVLNDDGTEDFYDMASRVHLTDKTKIAILSKKRPVTFKAFDCIYDGGEDVRNEPLYIEPNGDLTDITRFDGIPSRHNRMKEIVGDTCRERIQVVLSAWFSLEKAIKISKERDWEGIVIKSKEGKYNDQWYKIKNWQEGDFKGTGYTSSDKNLIAALILENGTKVNYQLEQTEEMAKKLKGATAVVKYMKGKNNLRFAVLKELRFETV